MVPNMAVTTMKLNAIDHEKVRSLKRESCSSGSRARSWRVMNAAISRPLATSSDTTRADDQPSSVLRSTAYISARTAGTPVSSPRRSSRSPAVRWVSRRNRAAAMKPTMPMGTLT